jgi:hypothetical protein
VSGRGTRALPSHACSGMMNDPIQSQGPWTIFRWGGMTKTNALPRPAGAIVLSLLAIVLSALVLPASSLAAPLPEGGDPVLTLSPQPAVVPTTTVGNQSPTVEFQLHNESGEEAGIEKVTPEGEDAGEFSFGGSNCGTLQPGDSCSVWIALKPNSVGLKKTTLYARFAGGRPEQTFEVSGDSVPPHFSFNPGSHDFGLLPIHNEAGRTTFQLENDGQAPAQVGSLNFSGGNSNGFWFGNSDCWGRWMLPGETCSIEVDFGPNETGSFATQVQVSSGSENFTAAVSGEGGQPLVEATPNPADFGPVTVGSSGAIETIAIANNGSVPTSFFIGIVAGGDAGSFKLLDENCSGLPLMPAGSCVAHIRFTPQSAGPKLARLAFFGDSEGGAMVTLSGEGVAPAVSLAPAAFDFGTQAAGTKSDGHAFAIRNDGSTPLELGATAIVGADVDQFALAGDECSGETLAPGAECLVRVRFAPDSTGAKAANLRVGSGGGPMTAALSGLGVAGPDVPAGHDLPPAGLPSQRRWHRAHHRFGRGDALAPRRARRARCHAFAPCRKVIEAKPLSSGR